MVDTEQSGVEQIYKPNDVVWVKISGMWWPAEVKDLAKVDPEVISGLRKSFICLVQFLLEESYLHINSLDNIYHYVCKKRMDFIQEGFKKYTKRKNEKEIAKFPQAIVEAERLTGGDTDIIKIVQEQQRAEESTVEGHLSGKKRSTLNHGKVVQPQGSRSSLPPRRLISANNCSARDTKSLSHEGGEAGDLPHDDRTPCFQHFHAFWIHTRPPPDEEGDTPLATLHGDTSVPTLYGGTPQYDCAVKNCTYTYKNFNVYMVHVESKHRHYKNIHSPIILSTIAGPSQPKKERKRKEEISAPVAKKKKSKVVGVDKEKTPIVKKTKTNKLDNLDVSQECEEILKDWDDDDEEMEGRRTSKDAPKTSSMDDMVDSDTQLDITLPPEVTSESTSQSVASSERAESLGPPKLLSCFDFDDQEQSEPDLTSNLKFGQKLPRLISPEKSKPTPTELNSLLDEVSVPEIPSLPSMRFGPSSTDSSLKKSEEASETNLRNASSSGKTDRNDRKTKAVPTEELSAVEATQASLILDPKNDCENSTEMHFLAEGPLQSRKRRSFGLTEGTEDGSGSIKKAKQEIQPSSFDNTTCEQIESGDKDVGKMSLSPNTSGLAPSNAASPVVPGEAKEIIIDGQDSCEKANIHNKELRISIGHPPTESKITSFELDKQSLIDTLTYSPSSVETNTSQKKKSSRRFSKKSRHSVSSKKSEEPPQPCPRKHDIVSELMNTLTHSPDSKSALKRLARQKKSSKRRSKSVEKTKEPIVNTTGDDVKRVKGQKNDPKMMRIPDSSTLEAAIAMSPISNKLRSETRATSDGSSKKRYIRPSSDSSIDDVTKPEVNVVTKLDKADSYQLTETSSPLPKTPRSNKSSSRRNSNDSSKKKQKLGSPGRSSTSKTKTSSRHSESSLKNEDSCSKESSRAKLDFEKIEFLGASKLMPMTNAEGDIKERKSPSKKSLKSHSQSPRTKVSGKSSSQDLDVEPGEKTPCGNDTDGFLGATKLATNTEAGHKGRTSLKKSRKSASQSPRSKVTEKSPLKDFDTVPGEKSSITSGKATNEFLGASKISPKTNTEDDCKERKSSKKSSTATSKSSRSKLTGESPLKDLVGVPDGKPPIACEKDADEFSEADNKDRKSSKKSQKSDSQSLSSKHLELVPDVKPSIEEGKDSDEVVCATKLMTSAETGRKDRKSSKKSPKSTSQSRSKVWEQSPLKNLELVLDVKSSITGENAAGEFLGASNIIPTTTTGVDNKDRKSSKRSQRSASQSPKPKVLEKSTSKDLETMPDENPSIPCGKDSDEFLDAPKLVPFTNSDAGRKDRKWSEKSPKSASQSISGQSPLKNLETRPDGKASITSGKDSDELLGPPKLLPMTNSEADRKDIKSSKKPQRSASQSSRSKVSEKSPLKVLEMVPDVKTTITSEKDADLSKIVSSKHGIKKDSAVKTETVDITGLPEPKTIITAPVVSLSTVEALEVPSEVRKEENFTNPQDESISVESSQNIEPKKQMSTDASTHEEVGAQIILHKKLDFVSELEEVGSQKETTLESKEVSPPSEETELFPSSVDQLHHVQESRPQECHSKPADLTSVRKPKLEMSVDLKPTEGAISIPENLTALDDKSKSPMKIDEISSLSTRLHGEEDALSSKSPTPFKVPKVRLDAGDELPEISSAPARASRWDNPYPLKKGERASTPTQSLRSSPTKMASPGSKVKVEIKSGIKSGFRSPPPGIVCDSSDSNVGDSISSKLPTDCHDTEFFLPIRLGPNSDELDAPKLSPLTQDDSEVAPPVTKSDSTDSLLDRASSLKLPADVHQGADVALEYVPKSDFVGHKSDNCTTPVSPKVRSEIKAGSILLKLPPDQQELAKCDNTDPKDQLKLNSSKPYDHEETKVVTSPKVDFGKILGTSKSDSVDPIFDISDSSKLPSHHQETNVNTSPIVVRESTASKIGRSPRSNISTSTVEVECEDLELKSDCTNSTNSPSVSGKATNVTTPPKITCDGTISNLDSSNHSPKKGQPVYQETVVTPSLSVQPLVDTPYQMFEDELSALQAEILSYTDTDKVSTDSLKRTEVEPKSTNIACENDASKADKVVDSIKCSSSPIKSGVDLDAERAKSSSRQSVTDIEISLAQQVDLDSIPLPEPANLEAQVQNSTSPSFKVPGLSEAALLASLLKDDDSTLSEENIISSDKESNQCDVAKRVSPAFVKKVEKRSPVKFSLLDKPNKFRSSSKLQGIALSKSKDKLREEKSAARRSLVSSPMTIPVSEPSILGDDETALPILKTPLTKTIFSSSLVESPSMNPAEVKVVSSQFIGQSSMGLLGGIDPLKELDINSIPIAFEEDLMKEGLLAYPTDGTSLHAPLIANFDSNVPAHAECISVAPPSISCIDVPKITANIAENFIDEVTSQEEIVTSEQVVTPDQVEVTTTEEVEVATTEEVEVSTTDIDEVAVTDQVEVTTSEQVAPSADIIFPEKNVPTGNSTTKATPKERRIYEAQRIRRIYIEVADIDDPHFEYLCSLPEACLTVNPSSQPPTIHSSCLPLAVPGTPLMSAATSSLQPTAVHTAPLLSTGLAASLPSTVKTTPLTSTVLTAAPPPSTVHTIPLPSSALTTPHQSAVMSTPLSSVRSAPPAIITDANNVGNITNAPPKSNNEMKVFPPGSLVAVNSSGKTKPTYYVSMNTPSGVKLCHAVMKSKPASKSIGDDKLKAQSSISQPKVVIRPNLAGGKSNYVVAIKKDPATGKSLISKGIPTPKVPIPAKPHMANIISKAPVIPSPKHSVIIAPSASGRTMVPSSVSAKTRKLVSRSQPSRSIIIQQPARSKTESDQTVKSSRKAP